jgi:hypothetical protein
MVLIVPLLDDTSFENGYPTAEEFVCSAVCEERICNSCTALTLFVFTNCRTYQTPLLRREGEPFSKLVASS